MKTAALVLASGSPRRREILDMLGIAFSVCPANVDEDSDEKNPVELVKLLSERKCSASAKLVTDKTDTIVLAADTIVFYKEEDKNEYAILGKPKSVENAKQMIERMAGNVHSVATGVTLIELSDGKELRRKTFANITDVYVLPMTGEEIDEYIAKGESMDKAGAYAIQGMFAPYIRKIDGDYYNVMGLPISQVMSELKEWGIRPVSK